MKRLTNDPAFDGDPAWSPFGHGVAFTSTRTGNREIFLMRFDGSQPLNIAAMRGCFWLFVHWRTSEIVLADWRSQVTSVPKLSFSTPPY